RQLRRHRQLAGRRRDLLDLPHGLDQRPLRPAFDAQLALDLAELGPEAAALPGHQAPERAIALQRAELGVDDLSFLYPHPRLAAVRLAHHDRALAGSKKLLEQVEQAEIAH